MFPYTPAFYTDPVESDVNVLKIKGKADKFVKGENRKKKIKEERGTEK
jgi:hypothetical protein